MISILIFCLIMFQKMHSKVKFLQAALHEPDDGPNPGEDAQGLSLLFLEDKTFSPNKLFRVSYS